MPVMPENRAYAGPHDAAEAMVSADRYVLVLRQDLTDEQADTLGYALDADDAVKRGRPFAVRHITVSDELGLKLEGSGFTDSDTGEFVLSWPKIGGKANAEDVVDDGTHPALKPVEVELPNGDTETISSSEADRRAYAAAGAERVLQDGELVAGDGAVDPSIAEAERVAAEGRLRMRLDDIVERLAADDDAPDEAKLPPKDRESLEAERDRIIHDLEGGN